MGNGWGGPISQTLDLNQLSCPLEQRSNLQSLSKTHVISKDATQAIAYIVHQPMIASSMHAWACEKIAWDGVSVISTSFVVFVFLRGEFSTNFVAKNGLLSCVVFLDSEGRLGWKTQQKRGDMKWHRQKKKIEGDTAGNQQKISSHTNHQASKIQNSYQKKKKIIQRSTSTPPPFQLTPPKTNMFPEKGPP